MTTAVKGWPSNSGAQWAEARKAVARILMAMAPGEKRKISDVCQGLNITKTRFRSVLWHARKDVAKLPDGGVYAVPHGTGIIYRMTAEEASENGRADANKGRRHFIRARDRIQTVNTSQLDDGQTQKHRLYEAQIATTLSALSPQKRAAAERKLSNGDLNAGDLSRLFG